MVPFDQRSPFVTSGLRLGTPAITTRGLKEEDMSQIVSWIDEVILHSEDEAVLRRVKGEVHDFMSPRPLFAE